jgi:hypothetical protein
MESWYHACFCLPIAPQSDSQNDKDWGTQCLSLIPSIENTDIIFVEVAAFGHIQ